MQDLVTHNFSKRRGTSVIVLVIIAIFGIASLCCVAMFKKEKDYFSEKKIYVVYVKKSLKQNDLSVLQRDLKILGGAGEIFKYKENYNLLSSVYREKSDADEVVKNISTTFKEADYLTLTIKKVSKSNRNLINSNKQQLDFFKLVNSFNRDFIEKQMLYLSGLVSNREISLYLIEQKIKIEKILDYTEIEENKLSDKLSIYQNTMQLYIKNFLDNFFESTKKNSLVCELAVNMALLQYEMTNNL